MQFSCESCKAQLQIADEKVRGRRLIVRCKRCGAKIALADPLLSKSPPRVVESAPPCPDTDRTRAMDSDLLEKALRASRGEDGTVNGSPLTQRFAAPSTPVRSTPVVQRVPMFEGAARTHGHGPDMVFFVALFASAAAAMVLWIVLGSSPRKSEAPGPQARAGAQAASAAAIGLTADQVR